LYNINTYRRRLSSLPPFLFIDVPIGHLLKNHAAHQIVAEMLLNTASNSGKNSNLALLLKHNESYY
jgi:hypothetical protein